MSKTIQNTNHLTKYMLKQSLLQGAYIMAGDLKEDNIITPENVFHYVPVDIPGLAAIYVYTLQDEADGRYQLTCVDRRRIAIKDISDTLDGLLDTIDADYDLCFTVDAAIFTKIGDYITM